MKNRTYSVLLTLVLSSSVSWITAQEVDKLSEEIGKIIRKETKISHEEIPGFIIGIIDHDSLFSRSFGTQEKDHNVAISDTSLFEIGGLSKVFSAHLTMILCDKGILDLNQLINHYLPEEQANPNYRKVSIQDLLCHHSGLPSLPNDMGRYEPGAGPYAYYRKADVLRFYRDLPGPTINSRYLYSHLNYALLEIIIELQTKSTYAEVLQRYLTGPLNLKNTFVDSKRNRSLAPGYDRAGRKAAAWSFQSFAASEGIKSNMQDLSHYMQYLLLTNSGKSLLKQMLSASVSIPNSRRAYASMGWHFFKSKKSNLYLHSGKTDGHAASIHYIQSTKTAVIILTNSPGKMDGLATLILRMINQNWKRKS